MELLLGEATFWELVTLVLEAGQGQRHAPSDVSDRWTEAGLVRLKAAIWGVANAATSPSASISHALYITYLVYKCLFKVKFWTREELSGAW